MSDIGSNDDTRTTARTSWTPYLFYPVALAGTLAFIEADVNGLLGPLGKAYPLYLFVLIATMVTMERIMPMRRAWGMTRQSFLRRDLPMLVINGAAIAATSYAVTWLAQRHLGLALRTSTLPWQVQAIGALLMSDFVWYWIHRHSHEGRGWLGRWLWKIHAIHHLPAEVYVFMHAVGHPINGIYVRVILMLPTILFGFTPQAVFAATVFNGFQGLVAHFNVDSRAGWFNRLFIGTQLHRFHHSANMEESKNYGATFSLWDQLFGTYRLPDVAPERLGVVERALYPADAQWLKLLKMPF